MGWIERWLVVLIVLVSACGSDPPDGACTDGETRACYDGPAGTEGVGSCTTGIETCVNGAFPGICIGDVVPFVESCDGVDEDCNGVVDDASGTGNPCTNADDCDGATACIGASIGCVGLQRNECDVCGGVAVGNLGGTCAANECTGQLVCNLAGDDVTCDAPSENACGLCGGPTIVGLDDDCNVSCPGLNVCAEDGEGVVCDCNPQPGMCRAGGIFRAVVSPQIGDLVVTELMPSPSGDQTKREWFEVLVTADVDLNQLALDRVSDNLDPDVLASVDCISVTAGTRLVFARSAVTADNGGLPAVAGTFSFTMLTGSVGTPGDLRILVGGAVIDAVTWTGSTSATSLQLDPDTTSAAANDDPAAFCASRTPYGDGDLGTPGVDNLQCIGANECLGTGGIVRTTTTPVVGDLVITEVMPSPSGDDNLQEWFEVEVKRAVDLNGLALDRVDDNRQPDVLPGLDCLPVTAGSRLVFARSAVTADNGGLPAVTATFGFSMIGGSVIEPGDLRILIGGTVLDAVTWTRSTANKALQLDLGTIDPVANDLETNLCDATSSYNGGSDLGTPGQPNAVCPPGPGECLGSDGFRRAVDKPTAGQLVITEFMADPATPGDATAEWFEIVNVGPGPFDLNDLDLQGGSGTPQTISSTTCKSIAQDGFAVFGRTANLTDNGGVVVDATFTFALTNSNFSVSVLDGSTVLDTVSWAAEPQPGRSRMLVTGQVTTTGNDSQTNFCSAPNDAAHDIDGAGTGINFGTPRAANDCP